MYSQILVPLDGSKTAEKALPYARALASKFKLSVELLAVILALVRRVAILSLSGREYFGRRSTWDECGRGSAKLTPVPKVRWHNTNSGF